MNKCIECGKEFDPMGLYLDVCHECNTKYAEELNKSESPSKIQIGGE